MLQSRVTRRLKGYSFKVWPWYDCSHLADRPTSEAILLPTLFMLPIPEQLSSSNTRAVKRLAKPWTDQRSCNLAPVVKRGIAFASLTMQHGDVQYYSA